MKIRSISAFVALFTLLSCGAARSDDAQVTACGELFNAFRNTAFRKQIDPVLNAAINKVYVNPADRLRPPIYDKDALLAPFINANRLEIRTDCNDKTNETLEILKGVLRLMAIAVAQNTP